MVDLVEENRILKENIRYLIGDSRSQSDGVRPRILDIAYTAFLNRSKPNPDDGGPSDWFNDTLPNIELLISNVRKNLGNFGVNLDG